MEHHYYAILAETVSGKDSSEIHFFP